MTAQVLPLASVHGDGYLEHRVHLAQQRAQVLRGGREQALRQQHLPGEAVAQDPQDFVAYVGLQPIQRQDHASFPRGDLPQALSVRQRARKQLVVALQQIGDVALGDVDGARPQGAVNREHALMLRKRFACCDLVPAAAPAAV